MTESMLSSFSLMKIHCYNPVSKENMTELVKFCTASPTKNVAFIYAARLTITFVNFPQKMIIVLKTLVIICRLSDLRGRGL